MGKVCRSPACHREYNGGNRAGFGGFQMSFRKLLISLSLVVLLAVGALAQNQSPQTPAPTQNPPATTAPTPAPPTDTPSTDSADTNPAPVGNPPIQEPDASKVKHTGGEDDVDAIGNRNVGGRGIGDWYSLETEIRMGKQYAMQVENSVKLVQDPVVNEYVNRIGQNLVRNSDAKVPFTIKVIDSDEVNAFALPGGFFYVNSGLILAADEEAELAGVMAHEISHVAARHGMRQMTRANIAQLATIPLIFVGGGIGYGIYEAAGLGLPLTFMKFQRNFEAEADYLGLQYMYKAGYDPQAFISFFEKIKAQEKTKPGTLAKAFATHPQTPDRIEKSQAEIRNKLIQAQDVNKPTLRKTTADSSASQSGQPSNQPDDDRPTLSKRDDDYR